ncbi:MAG: hypothetical protein Q8P67_00695 [archaeon]|nr:hypothetical protein [archaeon]
MYASPSLIVSFDKEGEGGDLDDIFFPTKERIRSFLIFALYQLRGLCEYFEDKLPNNEKGKEG